MKSTRWPPRELGVAPLEGPIPWRHKRQPIAAAWIKTCNTSMVSSWSLQGSNKVGQVTESIGLHMYRYVLLITIIYIYILWILYIHTMICVNIYIYIPKTSMRDTKPYMHRWNYFDFSTGFYWYAPVSISRQVVGNFPEMAHDDYRQFIITTQLSSKFFDI